MIRDLKEIGKILQEAGKIEQYQQILELLGKSLEMQKRIADLEKENTSLTEKLKIRRKLEFSENAYWLVDGSKKDGPYCTRCWDKEKEAIRMHPTASRGGMRCPECKNTFHKQIPESSPY